MDSAPLRPRLDDERRGELAEGLRTLFAEEFDEDLSGFRADAVIDFFLRHLGATVYNQAVQDVRAWMQERIDDLDVDLHEPEARP